ncbi:hypothetical protein Krac_7020 [Ktedonobacter racemifer DSM 44963]|uniref:Uncharacterized protein n=1 Tax=Ktedonobacter racemifer DSM 44963 TaxID=485913 RepID=D6TQD3_KTERA|nr:hypothetical protein Krac_7020 [Ktedonobacter racemifer DSM 44963]
MGTRANGVIGPRSHSSLNLTELTKCLHFHVLFLMTQRYAMTNSSGYIHNKDL